MWGHCFLNVYLIEDIQGSESIVYWREHSAPIINSVFCFILPAHTDFCWTSQVYRLLRLCFMFLLGGKNPWANTIFLIWYGIHKYFVLPILLERVAILRDLHLVCGLKFDSRLEKGEYWGSNAQCLFLRRPSLLSACLGMWRLTANGEERIPLIPTGWLCRKHYCASNSIFLEGGFCVSVSVLDSIWKSVFSS